MPTYKITDADSKNPKVYPPGSYQDDREPYLWLHVTETSRTWGLYKWSSVIRKPVRKSLGPIKSLGVEEARKKVRALVVRINDGESLSRPESANVTLEEIVRSYTLKLKGQKRRHFGYMEKVIELSFGDWLTRPFASITKAALFDRHQKIAADDERGPMAAARAIHCMRTLYKFAEEADKYSGKNLAKSITVKQQAVRKRIIRQGELAKIMESLDKPDHSTWVRPYFKLLMLTGARRHNVASMAWKHVDLENATWHIPAENAKAGDPIDIPLLPEAVEILKARVGLSKEWAFPAPKSASGHLMEPHFAWKKVLELAGVENDITIHDIRRSFGSSMAAEGIPLSIVATLMGHKNPATTARHYSVTTAKAARDALAKVLG
jgi:integrase